MDISILEKQFSLEGGARGGIFFMALNLLYEFMKREDIELSIYANNVAYYRVRSGIYNSIPELQKIKLYTDSRCCAIFNFYKSRFKIKRQLKYLLLSIMIFPVALIAKLGTYITPRKYDTEIYFSTYNYPPYSICKQKSIKKFIYLHDVIPILDFYRKLSGKTFKKKIFNKLEKENFYFTNSEYTRQDFIKYNPNVSEENSKTVLLAAADNFKPSKENFEEIKKKYNIPDGKKYIFSLCTLEPRKNLIRIVKTFVEFIKKHNIDDIVFVMGGGQWEKFKEELAKVIDNLSEYKDKIIKIGYVQDEDLPILYSNAEWFVYTSQYEGFGLPPLEAMSCGCPVIVSNSTSLPEVVGDAGIQINYDSDEEHVEAYEKFYFNPELRAEYSKKGLLRASIFSYKKTADELLSKMLAD